MSKQWTTEELLMMGRAYQPAAVLSAAAELDLFSQFDPGAPFSLDDAAHKLRCDPRPTRVLLDALAALQILDKRDGLYQIPPGVAGALSGRSPHNVLAMTQHQANCMRRWAELARVAKTNQPAPRTASVRGADGDYESFIEAMDNISAPVADRLVSKCPKVAWKHLLDVGGGSGTWTIAFLRANPSGRATIFDLPQVMPQAKGRLEAAGMIQRVNLAAGDFHVDPLPGSADLAWVSAIVHSNSRPQNRRMLASVWRALSKGGHVLIRDFIMDADHSAPPGGALFAVNMLVGTDGGGTYSFDELRQDLESAGFADVTMPLNDKTMDSLILATKPA